MLAGITKFALKLPVVLTIVMLQHAPYTLIKLSSISMGVLVGSAQYTPLFVRSFRHDCEWSGKSQGRSKLYSQST